MDLLVKPIDPDYLVNAVWRAEQLVLLRLVRRLYQAKLEEKVQTQTHEFELLNKELRESKIDIMKMRDLQLTKLLPGQAF